MIAMYSEKSNTIGSAQGRKVSPAGEDSTVKVAKVVSPSQHRTQDIYVFPVFFDTEDASRHKIVGT